jgi:hypothetical protein
MHEGEDLLWESSFGGRRGSTLGHGIRIGIGVGIGITFPCYDGITLFKVGEMEVNCCNVLAEPDSQEILAVARYQIEIYWVKSAWVGLESNVKLSVIELKDRILGNVSGTHDYFLPPVACKIETLEPNNLSLMLI